MTLTEKRLYRNWPAICKVKNDLLRLLVATTEDEEVLEGLRRGFPELFCEEETELRVPASALREKARQLWPKSLGADCDGVELTDWGPAIAHFNIPYAAYWSYGDPKCGPAPLEICRQLVGQKWGAGMRVEYRGVSCVVSAIEWKDRGPDVGEVVREEVPEIYFMRLVPAKFVDLDI